MCAIIVAPSPTKAENARNASTGIGAPATSAWVIPVNPVMNDGTLCLGLTNVSNAASSSQTPTRIRTAAIWMISCEYGDSPVVSRSKMIKFMNPFHLPFSPPSPTQNIILHKIINKCKILILSD